MVADAERTRSRSPVRVIAARHLLESWARGHNSTREVWWQADGHVQDGNSNPTFIRFLKLASVGNEKNVFRNMVSLMKTCGVPQLVHAIAEERTVTHTLPPTVIFSLLHRSNRDQFGRSFGAYRSKLKEFRTGFFFKR